MKVSTQSPHLARLRRGVMELYISDHPLDCLTCSANGNCELQDMAGVVGLREVRYGLAGDNHFDAAHAAPKDESNPYFSFEPAKCIVCSRCAVSCPCWAMYSSMRRCHSSAVWACPWAKPSA